MPASNRVPTVRVKGPNGEVVINESDFLANPKLYEPVDERSKELATQFMGLKEGVGAAGTSKPLPSTTQAGAPDPSTAKSAPDPSTTPATNPAKPPVPPAK